MGHYLTKKLSPVKGDFLLHKNIKEDKKWLQIS